MCALTHALQQFPLRALIRFAVVMSNIRIHISTRMPMSRLSQTYAHLRMNSRVLPICLPNVQIWTALYQVKLQFHNRFFTVFHGFFRVTLKPFKTINIRMTDEASCNVIFLSYSMAKNQESFFRFLK